MRKILLISICLIQFFIINAQYPQSKIWYFGYNAGIDFNSGNAVAILDGNMTSIDGCATITDKNGNLLFYSNGLSMWDKSMNITTSGAGLMGAASSCQSAVFIPYPGDTTKMILATMDMIENSGAKGLCYNVIDMTLNGGKGDIISGQKNILLTKPACEKVLAVPHSNGKDIWLITYKAYTDSILSYLITSSGVSKSPVRSNTGYSITGDLNKTLGYLKISHNFKKLASAHYLESKVLLMDFNNSTGKVSNVLQWSVTSPDGVEFSPNDSLLYVSGFRGPAALYQYDISSNAVITIKNSEETIYTFTDGYDVGALQLGPDNKIYLAKNNQPYLSVINSPNKSGFDCNFVSDGFFLKNRLSAYGLPNYFFSNLKPTSSIAKINKDNTISIFPNPGSSYLNIINSGNSKVNYVSVFDANGKLLLSKYINEMNCHLDVEALAEGLYFVSIFTNESSYSYKWLKQ